MMKKLDKLRLMLSGKKSYAVALLMILLGILTEDTSLVLEGLAVVGLRAGISSNK